MITEAERFSTDREELCHCLRWKGQFILADRDPSVPRTNDGIFWCVYTQSCIGPDGELAEPGTCSTAERGCHGKGHV